MDSILRMNNIEKYYGSIKALDGAFLDVQKGEVHALLGANGAGKSTLMKVLFGELPFDNGEILFDGITLNKSNKWKATDIGIGMVHQEISVVSEITVAQYMFLGREKKKGIFIDDTELERLAEETLSKIDSKIKPSDIMGSLSVAKQQMVEIAKALTLNIKLLVLDEPTAALGDAEIKRLFKVIFDLKKRDVSIIYISHRLDEIIEIADRITILKDGKYINTLKKEDATKELLIRLLAGHDIIFEKRQSDEKLATSPVVLEVKNLGTKGLLSGVNLTLKKGEILGLAGLMGSGRTETAKAICGIDKKTSGEIFVNGEKVSIKSPKDAAKHGICYLSEDRNAEGMIQDRSIIGNSVISSLDKYSQGPFLDDKKMLKDAVAYNKRLKTKYSDPHSPISSLSGGNCQKVIISRWLIRDLPILIFDEPTKGIDVGAKDEIYQIIGDIAKNGHSVIIISSETEELLRNCDRIIVMREGKVSGEMNIEEATYEKIMQYSMGVKDE